MSNKVAIYIPKENYLNEATNYYCDMILDGLDCFEKRIITRIRLLSPFDIILVLDAKSLIFVKLCYPFKKIITWYQGVVPEESLIQFNSKFKYYYWRVFERISLKYSFMNVFVSETMRIHFKKVYGYSEDNFIIAPCFNKSLSPDIILNEKEKYNELSFVYAGSLHKWQCIDQTLRFFQCVQKRYPSASLLFLTFKTAEAREVIEQYELNNVVVDSVSEKQVDKEIAKCRFGFLIREDNIVNNVATPTKMSTYLSVGTIPIMTSAMVDFSDNINTKYIFSYTLDKNIDSVMVEFEKFIYQNIDVDELISEYNDIFLSYYNRTHYVNLLNCKLNYLLYKGTK